MHSALEKCVISLLGSDIQNAQLEGKRVLYRVDLNLPLTKHHQVADATRLHAILPTLELLLRRRARVVLCSHLGRPNPATQSLDEMRKEFSLAPVAQVLQQQLPAGTFAGLVPECVGPAAVRAVETLAAGQVMLCRLGNSCAG
jgi:phosphoglycerate kinase